MQNHCVNPRNILPKSFLGARQNLTCVCQSASEYLPSRGLAHICCNVAFSKSEAWTNEIQLITRCRRAVDPPHSEMCRPFVSRALGHFSNARITAHNRAKGLDLRFLNMCVCRDVLFSSQERASVSASTGPGNCKEIKLQSVAATGRPRSAACGSHVSAEACCAKKSSRSTWHVLVSAAASSLQLFICTIRPNSACQNFQVAPRPAPFNTRAASLE